MSERNAEPVVSRIVGSDTAESPRRRSDYQVIRSYLCRCNQRAGGDPEVKEDLQHVHDWRVLELDMSIGLSYNQITRPARSIRLEYPLAREESKK